MRTGLAWGGRLSAVATLALALWGCPATKETSRGWANGPGAHVDPGQAVPGAAGQGGSQPGGGSLAGSSGSGGGSIPGGSGAGPGAGAGGTGGGALPPGMNPGAGGSGGMQLPPGSGGSAAMSGAVFDAGSDPARNQVRAGQVCARLAQIQCAGEAFCCTNPGRDRAACEAAQLTVCTTKLYLDAISGNAITGFDATAAAAAFDGLEQRASQCDPSIASFGASLQGLLGMMKGTVAANGSCATAGLDEASAAAALASCKNIATTACLPTTLAWICSARGGAGASCFTDVNCTDGLYCPNPNAEIGTKKCEARKAVGAACTTQNECMTLYCKGGACVDATAQAAYCLAAP